MSFASTPTRPSSRLRGRPTLLLAVAPPLRRVVEHLLAGLRLRVVGRPRRASTMVAQARRRRPDVILVDAKLLGRESLGLASAAKRASPGSRVVLILPAYGPRSPISGADARLSDEDVVRKLSSTVWALATSKNEPVPGHRNNRSNTQ